MSYILAFVPEKFLPVIKCPLSDLFFDMTVSIIFLMKAERGKAETGRSLEACWPADQSLWGNSQDNKKLCLKQQIEGI